MTQQRRYYILIASLVLSFSTHRSYAYNYASTDTIHEVGFSTPYCATHDADTCALCETTSISACAPDNECMASTFRHSYYKDGDYLKSSDTYHPGYYLCVKGSGWVYYKDEPVSCDPTTCRPDEWRSYSTLSEVRQNAWCEGVPGGSTCITAPQYRCINNYYCNISGSECRPADCTACPSSTDYLATETGISSGYRAPGFTQDPGATSITQCYIEPTGGSAGGEGYISSTGVYKFIKNCFHD